MGRHLLVSVEQFLSSSLSSYLLGQLSGWEIDLYAEE